MINKEVRETEHGDPRVTLTFEGTHDVSRLVHLLAAKGNCEQGRIADELIEELRRNVGGMSALQLLADHGGPDFTASNDAQV
jgi:hypothetical protein